MITTNLARFLAFAKAARPDFAPPCAKAAFLVSPEQFALAEQSAGDNRYMDLAVGVDAARASMQHRALHQALSTSLPTIAFAGHPDTPDGLFPNNVFAVAGSRLIVGHMRHPVRQAEAERYDIRAFFTEVAGAREIDLRRQPGICELTGSLIIDHARGLGFCGLSERCDEVGAAAMHAAFGLRATLLFELAPHEYHSNVVLSILAGRAVVIAPDGFADPDTVEAIAELYAPHVIRLNPEEKRQFAGNCLALTPEQVWMSATGEGALSRGNQSLLQAAGFTLRTVPMDEIEKAGGSLRCCIAEIH